MTSDESASPPEPSVPEKTLKAIIAEKSGVLSTSDTMEEAGAKMRSMNTGTMPVSEGTKLVGTISDRDPDRKSAGRGHDPKQTRVGEAMSREVVFCYEDQDRGEAERLMIEKDLRYLPVVDRDLRIVGMITRDDLGSSETSTKPPAISVPNHLQEPNS